MLQAVLVSLEVTDDQLVIPAKAELVADSELGTAAELLVYLAKCPDWAEISSRTRQTQQFLVNSSASAVVETVLHKSKEYSGEMEWVDTGFTSSGFNQIYTSLELQAGLLDSVLTAQADLQPLLDKVAFTHVHQELQECLNDTQNCSRIQEKINALTGYVH